MPYYTNNPNEIYHHGVAGMKWGVRRAHLKSATAKLRNNKGHNKGPVNVANSAARDFYRAQNHERKANRSSSFKTYKHQQNKAAKARVRMERKMAQLTPEQINAGRYRVAQARNLKRTAVSALVAGGASAALVASGAAAVGVAVAAPVYITSRYATGGRRYRREAKSYQQYANKNY